MYGIPRASPHVAFPVSPVPEGGGGDWLGETPCRPNARGDDALRLWPTIESRHDALQHLVTRHVAWASG